MPTNTSSMARLRCGNERAAREAQQERERERRREKERKREREREREGRDIELLGFLNSDISSGYCRVIDRIG